MEMDSSVSSKGGFIANDGLKYLYIKFASCSRTRKKKHAQTNTHIRTHQLPKTETICSDTRKAKGDNKKKSRRKCWERNRWTNDGWMHAESRGKGPTCLVSFKHFLRWWTHFHHFCSLSHSVPLSRAPLFCQLNFGCMQNGRSFVIVFSARCFWYLRQNKTKLNFFLLLLSLLINIGMGKISTCTSEQQRQQIIPVNLIIEWKFNAQLIVFHEFVVSISMLYLFARSTALVRFVFVFNEN